MNTRLRFTSNPVLVILLGVMIVVASRCFETMVPKESLSPCAMLLVGSIPELLLVGIIARASIQRRRLQTRFAAAQHSLMNLRPLTASLIQSILADRHNLSRLHQTTHELASMNNQQLADRIVITAANFEHTYSIAQRLSLAMDEIRRPLSEAEPALSVQALASSRIEPQHLSLASMKLRTLPNGSLDRNQLVEMR